MWRNDRRNGLKIAVFAVPLLFIALQFNARFPGKLRKICDLAPFALGGQKGRLSCTNSCTRAILACSDSVLPKQERA